MKKKTKVEKVLIKMLKENTGTHMCDSGGHLGRYWERNQERDFEKEPEVEVEQDEYGVRFHVNLFHFLKIHLDMDGVSERFNQIKQQDMNGDFNMSSIAQSKFLSDRDFEGGVIFNTYNWENMFAQGFQFQMLRKKGEEYWTHVLLAIHQGCDIRGGYTDVKMFEIKGDGYYFAFDGILGSFDYENRLVRFDIRGSDVDFVVVEGEPLPDEVLNGFGFSHDHSDYHQKFTNIEAFITHY